jgi:hypothetical protein
MGLLIAFIISDVASAQATSAVAQPPQNPAMGDPNRVVQILQEPRHRQVHRDGDIYVLDVQINPGDMTLQHTHDAAILYNFISTGAGPAGGRVSSNTDYATKRGARSALSSDAPSAGGLSVHLRTQRLGSSYHIGQCRNHFIPLTSL